MKNLILYIHICILLSACQQKCTDTPNLTSDELAWLPYTNGQMLVYKCDTGGYDTAYVVVSFNDGIYHADDKGCYHYCQSGTNEIKFNDGSDINISVYHGDQWFPEYYNSAGFGPGTPFSKVVPQDNIILQGKTYNNVYIIGADYYIKGYGIVAIVNNITGVNWVRVN